VRYRAIPSKVSGTIRAPPSKSYTHRAIILAALSGGPCLVRRPLQSEDTDATVAGMAAFGAAIRGDGDDLRVSAESLHTPAKPIDARNSGTTLRLLAGVASLQAGETTLTGDSSLRRRPMGPLVDALNRLGARARARGADGRPPVDVRGLLGGGDVSVPGNVSSQFLSSLLIACPLAPRPSEIRVLPPFRSEPYVDATRHLLNAFGVEVSRADDTFRVPGSQLYRPADVDVPGDFSSAAFPLVAAALTEGDVRVIGLDADAPQGDRRIVDLLRAFGARVDGGPDSVRVRGGPLVAQTVDVGATPDLFPILAVLATQAEGETRFVNGDQLRLKESDRIASTVAMLRALGGRAEPTPDGCAVWGPSTLHGGSVDSTGDHRILMAAGVAGLVAHGAVDISDPWCFRVSYPAYLDDLRALGALHAVVA
jgi:3-phosphoshikimate 1-carboxyvinyltransferase